MILNKASKGIHRGKESLQQMVLDNHVKKREAQATLSHHTQNVIHDKSYMQNLKANNYKTSKEKQIFETSG